MSLNANDSHHKDEEELHQQSKHGDSSPTATSATSNNQQQGNFLLKWLKGTSAAKEGSSSRSSTCNFVISIFLILLGYSLDALCPVFARYLQTVEKIPPLSLAATSTLLTIVLYMPFMTVYWIYRCTRKGYTFFEKTPFLLQQQAHDEDVSSPSNEAPTAKLVELDQLHHHHNEDHHQAVEMTAIHSHADEAKDNHEDNVDTATTTTTTAIAVVTASTSSKVNQSTTTTTAATGKQKLYIFLISTLVCLVFTICRVGKAFCNVYANRYTEAINTQLVALSSPFVVSFTYVIIAICQFCYHRLQASTTTATTAAASITTNESQGVAKPSASTRLQLPFNWKMFITILLACAGGALFVLGKYTAVKSAAAASTAGEAAPSFTFHLDFGSLFDWNSLTHFSYLSMLGLFYSIVSVLMFPGFIILSTAIASDDKSEVLKYNAFRMSGTNLNFYHTLMLGICALILSVLVGEDWTPYLRMSHYGWFSLFVYVVLGYAVCDLIFMIGTVMAGSMSSAALMPSTIITTAVMGWLVLDEKLNNLWQIIGIVAVIVGTTLFIVFRSKLKKTQNK